MSSNSLKSHYLNILQFCFAIKGYILYEIDQTASKSGYSLTNYGKFTANC